MPKIFYFFDLKDFVYLLYVFIAFAFSKSLSRDIASLLKLDKEDKKTIGRLIFSLSMLFFGLLVILRLFVFLDSIPPQVFNRN